MRKLLRSVSKKVAVVVAVVGTAIVTGVTALAVDPTGVVPTGMDTGMAQIKADALAGIGAVVPYALAIVGVFLVWKYGLAFFKKVAK